MHAAAGSHAQCFLRVLSKAEKISTTILKRDHFLEIWHFLTIFEILICFEAGNASLSLGCQIFAKYKHWQQNLIALKCSRCETPNFKGWNSEQKFRQQIIVFLLWKEALQTCISVSRYKIVNLSQKIIKLYAKSILSFIWYTCHNPTEGKQYMANIAKTAFFPVA